MTKKQKTQKVTLEQTQTLDEKIDDVLKDESPTAAAVSSLIDVQPRLPGETTTDVELKTDLTPDEVRQHAALSVIGAVLEMSEGDFSSKSILSDLIEIKERKAISKDRQSRGEIVDVARNPDSPIVPSEAQEGFLKRFMTSRRKK